MATINFGAIAAPDMLDRFWGLSAYVSDSDPELVGYDAFPVASEIELLDPGSGSRVTLTGSFNLPDLLAEIYSTSTISAASFKTAGGALVFSAEFSEPVSIAPIFEEDDPFPFFILGNDIINGNVGDDTLFGSSGNDSLNGGFGGNDRDSLLGGEGNDILFGLNGDDTLLGGEGDDYLYGGAGDDLLDGGSDIDTAAYLGPFGNFVPQVGPEWAYVILSDVLGGSDGTDTLNDIERVEFGNTGFALDVYPGDQGYDALSLMTAGFGAASTSDKDLLGMILGEFSQGSSRQARSIEEVAQAVIDAYAPPGFGTDDLIYHLYFTITGLMPTEPEVDWVRGLGLSDAQIYVFGAGYADDFGMFDQVVQLGYVEYTPEFLL